MSETGARERWIALGAVAGFVLALWQALGLPTPGGATEPGVAARVNDAFITRVEHARAVEAIARDKDNKLTQADRQRALDTLITEELLVQQAEAIGLTHADRGVRKAIVDAMLQYVLTGLEIEPPTDNQLRLLYLREAATSPDRVRVAAAVVAGDGRAVAQRLGDGERFDAVFTERLTVPDTLVRSDALSTYLPPVVIETVAGMTPGDIAGPLQAGDLAYFVWLQDRVDGQRRSFEQARDALAAQWMKRQREAEVARYVQRLRRRADLEIAGS